MKVRDDEQEHSALAEAAGRAGLTSSGFLAAAGLSVATGQRAPAPMVREVLGELLALRTAIVRYGVLVNQARRRPRPGLHGHPAVPPTGRVRRDLRPLGVSQHPVRLGRRQRQVVDRPGRRACRRRSTPAHPRRHLGLGALRRNRSPAPGLAGCSAAGPSSRCVPGCPGSPGGHQRCRLRPGHPARHPPATIPAPCSPRPPGRPRRPESLPAEPDWAGTARGQLEKKRDTGIAHTAGRQMTMGGWLDHWLTISKRSVRPSTYVGYEGYVRNIIRRSAITASTSCCPSTSRRSTPTLPTSSGSHQRCSSSSTGSSPSRALRSPCSGDVRRAQERQGQADHRHPLAARRGATRSPAGST